MSGENTAPGIFEAMCAAVGATLDTVNDNNAKLDRALVMLDTLLALVQQRQLETTPAAKAAETGVAAPSANAQPVALVAAPVAPVGLVTPTAPTFATVSGESPVFAATKAAMYALANAKGREAAEAVLLKFGADRLGAVKESDLLAAQAAFVSAAA